MRTEGPGHCTALGLHLFPVTSNCKKLMVASKLLLLFLLLKPFHVFAQVVEMKEISPTVANGEPQPGLESQGRAASMPRLAAETQVRPGDWSGDTEQAKSSASSLCLSPDGSGLGICFFKDVETGIQALCWDVWGSLQRMARISPKGWQ